MPLMASGVLGFFTSFEINLIFVFLEKYSFSSQFSGLKFFSFLYSFFLYIYYAHIFHSLKCLFLSFLCFLHFFLCLPRNTYLIMLIVSIIFVAVDLLFKVINFCYYLDYFLPSTLSCLYTVY